MNLGTLLLDLAPSPLLHPLHPPMGSQISGSMPLRMPMNCRRGASRRADRLRFKRVAARAPGTEPCAHWLHQCLSWLLQLLQLQVLAHVYKQSGASTSHQTDMREPSIAQINCAAHLVAVGRDGRVAPDLVSVGGGHSCEFLAVVGSLTNLLLAIVHVVDGEHNLESGG